MITPGQIKMIHVLKSKLKLSENNYRAFLSGFGVSTSKDLDTVAAGSVIGCLEALAIEKGVWEKYSRKSKHENLKGREGMATPKQLRMIEAMWKDVSRIKDTRGREKALNSFLKRIVKVDDLRFLESHDVSKIVNALKAMKTREREKKIKEANMPTMKNKFEKVSVLKEGNLHEIVVKKGKKEELIHDSTLYDALQKGYLRYQNVNALKEQDKPVREVISSFAEKYLEDRGTITFTSDKTSCKITFGYICVIPEENVKKVKEILGARYEDLVNEKTSFTGTSKLIDLACDADKGGEISEYLEIKEKTPSFSFKKVEKKK